MTAGPPDSTPIAPLDQSATEPGGSGVSNLSSGGTGVPRHGFLLELFTQWSREPLLEPLCRHIAQGIATHVSADRVGIVLKSGSGVRLVAATATNEIERRGEIPGLLERLAMVALNGHKDIQLTRDSEVVLPELTHLAREYFDRSGSRWLISWPMVLAEPMENEPGNSESVGAILVEGFHGAITGQEEVFLRAIEQPVATLISNAQRVRRVPAVGFWLGTTWQRWCSDRSRWLRWGLLLLGVIGLALWPVRFEIDAEGELRPTRRREVYSPLDARVVEVAVDHGAQVVKGDKLLLLRSELLEQEQERLAGELETTRKRLAAIEAARVSGGNDRSDRPSQLSGDEAALREALESLQLQSRLLEKQQAGLTITAPDSGIIQTWNLRDHLDGRPVQRGQALLSVADLNSDWVVELRIPNRRAGHVLRAAAEQSQPLEVEYVLVVAPEQSHQGQIHEISRVIERHPGNEPYLQATVQIAANELSDLRPGSAVNAQISCGTRPLVYAMFHDLIDAIRGWVAL